MQLGITIRPAAGQPPTLRLAAVRAVRPSLVRLVLTDPTTADAWIQHARERGLGVLWCVPIEAGGLRTWHHALKALAVARVTAGVELGHAPDLPVLEYLTTALSAARTLAVYGVGRFGPDRAPVLLAGRSRHADDGETWTRTLLSIAALSPDARRLITGLRIAAAGDGALDTYRLRSLAMRVERLLGWRLALTYTARTLGTPISAPVALGQACRDVMLGTRPTWRRAVDLDLRDRWLLEAVDFAAVNASHLLIEPPPNPHGAAWPFYDDATGCADPIWHRMVWRAHRAANRLAAVRAVDAEAAG